MPFYGSYPSTLSSHFFSTLNSGALLAIPFFIVSAEILNRSGAAPRRNVAVSVGHNRGGLPVVAVIAVAFFSAIGWAGSILECSRQVNMELAVITPPIDLNLFVIGAISDVPAWTCLVERCRSHWFWSCSCLD